MTTVSARTLQHGNKTNQQVSPPLSDFSTGAKLVLVVVAHTPRLVELCLDRCLLYKLAAADSSTDAGLASAAVQQQQQRSGAPLTHPRRET